MKKLLLYLSAAIVLTACTGKLNADNKTSTTKSLVVFYSQTGATRQVAHLLAEKTGAHLDSLVAVKPYDGSFEETIARCQEEMKLGTLPELKPLTCDIANYDTLYIGTPVWFGTMAPPMTAYLKQANLSGKIIIPFVTFGSGGLETTVADIKKLQPDATYIEGYGVRNARLDKADAEIDKFLISRGIKSGSIDDEQPFGDERQLTEDDKVLWDAACGSYPMPLGAPSTVKERPINDGTEYCYKVNSHDAQGKKATSEVFVIKSNDKNIEPEFTHVVR